MNIAIRKRKRKDGQESLILDYYLPNADQKRKKESLNLYIYSSPKTSGERARNLLGNKDLHEERVFKGLKYSAWHNLKLQLWVMKAGISKTITFHCGRHTYATLQLTFGTDIYTVSKLLGHKELKTTQVYAKIINQKKVDAANAIPDINL
ncbi:MAG: tyrosine-type recombinase/integrase [Chlorobi bacterium]|nr:tyrosine-type recombinase/integrase [Chlorobiota bacterium]